MVKKKDKKVLLATVDCPHCNKQLEVWKETRIISPSIPAEKEENYTVTRGYQSKLDSD